MLPHTGLFLLWKVALQMRIRRPLHFDRKVKVGAWYIIKVLLHGIWHGKVNQMGEEMFVSIMHENFNKNLLTAIPIPNLNSRHI